MWEGRGRSEGGARGGGGGGGGGEHLHGPLGRHPRRRRQNLDVEREGRRAEPSAVLPAVVVLRRRRRPRRVAVVVVARQGGRPNRAKAGVEAVSVLLLRRARREPLALPLGHRLSIEDSEAGALRQDALAVPL